MYGEPLEVVASLAVITLAAAAGALAGDRLQALMRPYRKQTGSGTGDFLFQAPPRI